ncbi:hypothetical protein NMY22_g805 [Coprinellus aureogranulatus]|nr:hypothetical protein NMY22_g805 [Coprinellus aureogranulatus]
MELGEISRALFKRVSPSKRQILSPPCAATGCRYLASDMLCMPLRLRRRCLLRTTTPIECAALITAISEGRFEKGKRHSAVHTLMATPTPTSTRIFAASFAVKTTATPELGELSYLPRPETHVERNQESE